MVGRKEPRWCIAERRPTGPDLIYYTGLFKTRAEAEEEIKQRMTLPEKAGYRMHATELPEDRAKQPRRTSSRRSGRR